MTDVFVLHHVIVYSPENENVKLIGVYTTEVQGNLAIERLKNRPGFSDSRGNFHLEAYALDLDHWTEGFGPPEP